MKTYTVGVDHEKGRAFVQEWSSGVIFGKYVPDRLGERKYFETLEEAHDYVRQKTIEEYGGVTDGKSEEVL